MNHTLLRMAILCAAAGCLLQAQTDIRRATIKGQNGDKGKCTAEVVVDMVAEVSLYGDTGELRTLGGQPAQWRRLECTGPLPYNPTEFKFSGIDGRGSQKLLASPQTNRGAAVIRIEDPKSGSEGYTFDIEWRGGTASGSGSNYTPSYNSAAVPSQVSDACQNAVRDRAIRDFGYRDLSFNPITADTAPGRQDWVSGTFDTRGFRRDSFRFSCWMDYRTAQVRSVDVTRSGAGGGSGFGGVLNRQQAIRSCQDAVSARVQQDGYTGVRLRWADTDNRPGRQDRVEGTVSASGRDNLEYFLDFSCSVDAANSQVRNIDLRMR